MPLDLEETKTLLRRTPDVLDVLLHGLPDPWVREDEGPDTWSRFDVVGHLIEAEGTNWIPRVRHLIAHGEPAVFSPFDRFGFVEKSKGKSMAEMLAVVLAGLYFTAQTLRIGQETLRSIKKVRSRSASPRRSSNWAVVSSRCGLEVSMPGAYCPRLCKGPRPDNECPDGVCARRSPLDTEQTARF
jgi:hypothetical protein